MSLRPGELKRTPFKRTMPTESKVRLRKCAIKTCRQPFQPRSMTHKCCSPDCAAEHAKLEREKKDRQERQKGLQALKTKSDWLKDVERVFNEFIRIRDLLAGHGCISCGRHNAERWNAGHFKSVGAFPELRFNEDNVHLQCARPCNKDQGGNIHNYRIGLIARIGEERVALLEGPHELPKWTIDELKALRDHYRAKLKELKGTK